MCLKLSSINLFFFFLITTNDACNLRKPGMLHIYKSYTQDVSSTELNFRCKLLAFPDALLRKLSRERLVFLLISTLVSSDTLNSSRAEVLDGNFARPCLYFCWSFEYFRNIAKCAKTIGCYVFMYVNVENKRVKSKSKLTR